MWSWTNLLPKEQRGESSGPAGAPSACGVQEERGRCGQRVLQYCGGAGGAPTGQAGEAGMGRGLKEELLALCVGAFGDKSMDLDRLIKSLAESRALYLSREAGRPL